MAETHSPISYEPKDLTEENNSILVKPMLFHRPSTTSSMATPPPESDLDDEQIRNLLASPLCLQERKASSDRPTEKTLCQAHHVSEKVQGNLPQCSHTEESRVKKHFSTEKAFPRDLNQFEEKTKLSSGSLIRKKMRD